MLIYLANGWYKMATKARPSGSKAIYTPLATPTELPTIGTWEQCYAVFYPAPQIRIEIAAVEVLASGSRLPYTSEMLSRYRERIGE